MKLVALIVLGASVVAPALATLPEPVTATVANDYLGNLTVAPPSNDPPYLRRKFPTWSTILGKCDTKETVLKRDGNAVVTNSACSVVSGNWYLPFDGKIKYQATGELGVDHIVPLKEAWKSGASAWNTTQREAFANDLTRPQLVVVSDKLNRARGAKDPAHWMPPALEFRCTYARAWIHVKYFYNLTVDQDEKNALKMYLGNC